ncbi:gliding motility-associated C-terminal domain-containing protein [Adhaeribacter aquaticus]|uniref:gliding motility-associated C-terminal domain-containing protein n=1 Tax=Adhaeribacter aquaticus TaxID=299567 RepID=UPI0003F88928|nr:gliding motility-associated C-terminal domain-containing protein [Adhaeribacter aquaticus]
MKQFLLSLLLLFWCLSASATHIVGGELQLKYLAGSNYQITLNMYFDNMNGNRDAIDPTIFVSIFEKGTNIRITNITMRNPQESPVPYTFLACTSGSLSTNKIVYTQNVTLSESIYTSPNGYYMVWERCCRNGVISNIENPGVAGQAFYLEFPAVSRNGQVFRNSSPELFAPVSDYACLNELFYYNFGGTDPDGDSLVYEMVTPLNGWSSMNNAAPVALPAPYAPVRWISGIGLNNQIPGNPAISITPQGGFLSVRPSQLGLFVFGVKCSEYRNKVKIGEVRRDFQILVLNCPKNNKPAVNVKAPGAKTFYQEGQVIKIGTADNRCLNLFLSDTDIDENLTIEAKPVNFASTEKLLNITFGMVNRHGRIDSLKTSVCFSPCLDSKGEVYYIDFILSDDGCSLPKKDTIQVAFLIEPVMDAPPTISTSAGTMVFKPRMGETLSFEVTGLDSDNDLVSLSLLGQNFNVASQNIKFPAASNPGRATSQFTWPIDCKALNQSSYLLEFKATTIVCDKVVIATTTIEVIPDYANQSPTITADLANRTYEILFGADFSDSIFSADPDLDLIRLTASGDGFNLADYGMVFKAVSGKGKANSLFSWSPDCSIKNKNEFKVNFMVAEETCKPFPPQTISVTFKVFNETPATFVPANIFTPNNDGLNDFFEMPTLPPNFCESVFSDIKVFNRWGQLVFKSNDRQFKWDGNNVGDGIYYYIVAFSDKEFKGTVTKVR